MIHGNKMTGGYEDPIEFTRRIIKESSSCYPSPGAEMSGVEGSSNRGMGSFEGHLLKLMELMDLSNSTRKLPLNLRRRTTGQTILHLACKMGLHRFVASLLARGADPDPRDNGGYTALHMASMSNHTEIVRLLIPYGADPTLRTLSGLTAADVAWSKEVVRIIQRYEQHRRSQSLKATVHHTAASTASPVSSHYGRRCLSLQQTRTRRAIDPAPRVRGTIYRRSRPRPPLRLRRMTNSFPGRAIWTQNERLPLRPPLT